MSTITKTIDEKRVDTITLTINGEEVSAKKGATVLEAARGADIYIPTLCYDPDLKPYGACRLSFPFSGFCFLVKSMSG